jgi:hypothetical protein
MKTNFATNRKNNQQSTMKSVIIAASLMIVSTAAGAQEFWSARFNHHNETAGFYAGVTVENYETAKTNAATTAAFTAYLIEESEEILEVEEWMTEAENFGTFITIEEETESPLELESWMLNEKTFEVENANEAPLKMETWMTAENVWN